MSQPNFDIEKIKKDIETIKKCVEEGEKNGITTDIMLENKVFDDHQTFMKNTLILLNILLKNKIMNI